MAGWSGYFATDADVANEILPDLQDLLPIGRPVALGSGGYFLAGAPWSLCWDDGDFAARGLAAGHVLELVAGVGLTTATPEEDRVHDFLEVVSADAGTTTPTVIPSKLHLKRLGEAAGEGEPPALADGATGVKFAVRTFRGDLRKIGESMAVEFNVADPTTTTHASLFRRAAALRAARRYYFLKSQDAGDDQKDELIAKWKLLAPELKAIEDRLKAAYATAPGASGGRYRVGSLPKVDPAPHWGI